MYIFFMIKKFLKVSNYFLFLLVCFDNIIYYNMVAMKITQKNKSTFEKKNKIIYSSK